MFSGQLFSFFKYIMFSHLSSNYTWRGLKNRSAEILCYYLHVNKEKVCQNNICNFNDCSQSQKVSTVMSIKTKLIVSYLSACSLKWKNWSLFAFCFVSFLFLLWLSVSCFFPINVDIDVKIAGRAVLCKWDGLPGDRRHLNVNDSESPLRWKHAVLTQVEWLLKEAIVVIAVV